VAAGFAPRERLAALPGLTERMETDAALEVGGETRHVDVRVSRVLDRRGRFFGRTIIRVDTTDQVRMLDETQRLATTDDLTGLPTARHAA
jgi:hypothetical protein